MIPTLIRVLSNFHRSLWKGQGIPVRVSKEFSTDSSQFSSLHAFNFAVLVVPSRGDLSLN